MERKTRAEANGIGFANNRATTDRMWHEEIWDENELAQVDDDAKRAEAAKATDRRRDEKQHQNWKGLSSRGRTAGWKQIYLNRASRAKGSDRTSKRK